MRDNLNDDENKQVRKNDQKKPNIITLIMIKKKN